LHRCLAAIKPLAYKKHNLKIKYKHNSLWKKAAGYSTLRLYSEEKIHLVSFLSISIISTLMIAITSLIAYEILRTVWNLLPHLHIMPRLRVLLIVVPIFATHIINIWIYAGVYFLIENFTAFGHLTGHIAPAALTYESFIGRLYFSASTYASLGLGDIMPSQDLRMLTCAEVLNGLVLIGWTISFTYLTMEKFWSLPHHHKK
jgi:hypothetical protein